MPDDVFMRQKRFNLFEHVRVAVQRYFYFAAILLIVIIVVYGFSHTVGNSLLHPEKPPPRILYLHAGLASAWLVLLLTQTSLARLRQIRLHKSLGYVGLVLGAAMPVITLATRYVVLHAATPAEDEIVFTTVTVNDMLCFSTTFALAMIWRKKPEYHRRLIYIAAACLTVPAFARMPETLVIPPWWYLYADVLIALGMLRDLIADRRIHRVYWIGLPLLALCQSLAMALFLTAPPVLVATLHTLLNL
jgi:uncharacterized membrane protein YozB (DUF420 family)